MEYANNNGKINDLSFIPTHNSEVTENEGGNHIQELHGLEPSERIIQRLKKDLKLEAVDGMLIRPDKSSTGLRVKHIQYQVRAALQYSQELENKISLLFKLKRPDGKSSTDIIFSSEGDFEEILIKTNENEKEHFLNEKGLLSVVRTYRGSASGVTAIKKFKNKIANNYNRMLYVEVFNNNINSEYKILSAIHFEGEVQGIEKPIKRLLCLIKNNDQAGTFQIRAQKTLWDGDGSKFIHSSKKPRHSWWPEDLIGGVYQLAFSLHHLHESGFYVADIKPDNIACHEKEKGLRIADFGGAHYFEVTNKMSAVKEKLFFKQYPQICSGHTCAKDAKKCKEIYGKKGGYSEKKVEQYLNLRNRMEVFSLGLTFLQILSGISLGDINGIKVEILEWSQNKLPFIAATPSQGQIKRALQANGILMQSEELAALIFDMILPWDTRPSSEEVFRRIRKIHEKSKAQYSQQKNSIKDLIQTLINKYTLTESEEVLQWEDTTSTGINVEKLQQELLVAFNTYDIYQKKFSIVFKLKRKAQEKKSLNIVVSSFGKFEGTIEKISEEAKEYFKAKSKLNSVKAYIEMGKDAKTVYALKKTTKSPLLTKDSTHNLQNEDHILNRLHSTGEVKGIEKKITRLLYFIGAAGKIPARIGAQKILRDGDACKFIHNFKKNRLLFWTPNELLGGVYNLACALDHCHQNKIYLGNIKPDNIACHEHEKELRLASFGGADDFEGANGKRAIKNRLYQENHFITSKYNLVEDIEECKEIYKTFKNPSPKNLEEYESLRAKMDVFNLGISYLEILSGVSRHKIEGIKYATIRSFRDLKKWRCIAETPSKEQIQTALEKNGITLCTEELATLIFDMLLPLDQRISSAQVADRLEKNSVQN